MINNILLSSFIILIALSACTVTPIPVSNFKGNVYRLKNTLTNNVKVTVIIETSIIDDCGFFYTKPVLWGAESTRIPKTVTKKIVVRFNGIESWVRFSAYSDLVNIKGVKLNILNDGFQIIIEGGESSSHFIAYLYFDNDGFLVSRKVKNPSFPKEVWEETNYSFIRRTNM